MAWTQADVDALKTAMKSGTKRVSYQDRTVEYHSLAEMIDLLSAMEREVAGSGSAGGSRSTYASFGSD